MSETQAEHTAETDAAASAEERDLIARLAARGEKALGEIDRLPGGKTATRTAAELRTRAEELQRRVSGLDRLEQRLAGIEERLGELERVLGVHAQPEPPTAPEPGDAPPGAGG